MDPFASKLAFSAAAAGAALLGALFPRPDYEVVNPGRPWAQIGAVNAWQPASGMADSYSYSGALPAWQGPIDVYGTHQWRLAREREALEREEAELRRAVTQAVWPEEAPVVDEEQAEAPVVTVHRGGKPAEEVALEPAEAEPPVLAVVSDQ